MKKGFTLVELLGVIVILSVIGLLVTPLVLNVINESRNDVNDAQIQSIKRAAKNYTTDNVLNMKCESGCRVTLEALIDGGYLESKDLKNAKTNESIDLKSQVEIKWNGTKYSYTYPIN